MSRMPQRPSRAMSAARCWADHVPHSRSGTRPRTSRRPGSTSSQAQACHWLFLHMIHRRLTPGKQRRKLFLSPGGCSFVSIQTLILSVLITLRLLLPPGICVCKLSSPASRLLAAALGAKLPPPPPPPSHTDDDHSPGCPASSLAEGLGVAPPSGPGPIVALLLSGVAWSSGPDADDLACDCTSSTEALPADCTVPIAPAPLYVAHCALLF
jgi:hypothetical protein